jgi:RimJ/RimL family protein N-acetyltransferase
MVHIKSLETKRLLLKAPQLEHISSYHQRFANYEVIRYLSDRVPWPFPENGVQDYLESEVFPHQGKDRWMWGLFLKKAPDDLIGAIELWRHTTESVPENRGFWLGREFWGQGFMTEAANAVTDYAFDHLGFSKLVFSNALGNQGSRRIKEKTGARFVRVQPSRFVSDEFTESEIWELTKEDWEAHKRHE